MTDKPAEKPAEKKSLVFPRLEAYKNDLEKFREARKKVWIEALEAENGNISRAARIMEPPMSRQRATVFTKQLELNEFALKLRLASGVRNATGRPPAGT